ncbi:MAG TPA: hypothetical protein PLK17_03230 [Bacteroidales bacterium]|nr:hypothetical protein [Bacteroidales bacterium]HPJ04512.1 hypothetical protein [Bacteroidales bacterium]
MAITEDMEFPRLTPSGDRLPPGCRLFRKPEELTEEQFDLLAAAWAEEALEGDALSEAESFMAAGNGRRERAESFRRLRLAPGSEHWPGMRSCLRPDPVSLSFRRAIMPALMAAAMLALIIAGPASGRLKSRKSTGIASTPAAIAAAEIPAPRPIVVKEIRNEAEANVVMAESRYDEVQEYSPADENSQIEGDLSTSSGTGRVLPLVLAYNEAAISSLSPGLRHQMVPVSMTEVTPVPTLAEEKNWMLRGITLIAGAVTGKEKEIDGYAIANSCVSGINNLLGWEMELEKVSNRAGDPVAVSFSSSLLSFTKPLNKIIP